MGRTCRLVLSALRAKPNIRDVNVGNRAPEARKLQVICDVPGPEVVRPA